MTHDNQHYHQSSCNDLNRGASESERVLMIMHVKRMLLTHRERMREKERENDKVLHKYNERNFPFSHFLPLALTHSSLIRNAEADGRKVVYTLWIIVFREFDKLRCH
jgi:hypothetical protein